jgi:hypothetical protein
LYQTQQLSFSTALHTFPFSQCTLDITVNMSMSVEECQTPRPGFPKPVPDTPTNVMQQFSMKGKVIVVTGAAEGIGGAVADAMAEAGGDVALWYNSYVHPDINHVIESNNTIATTPQ